MSIKDSLFYKYYIEPFLTTKKSVDTPLQKTLRQLLSSNTPYLIGYEDKPNYEIIVENWSIRSNEELPTNILDINSDNYNSSLLPIVNNDVLSKWVNNNELDEKLSLLSKYKNVLFIFNENLLAFISSNSNCIRSEEIKLKLQELSQNSNFIEYEKTTQREYIKTWLLFLGVFYILFFILGGQPQYVKLILLIIVLIVWIIYLRKDKILIFKNT